MKQIHDNGTGNEAPEIEQGRVKNITRISISAFFRILPDVLALFGGVAITYGTWLVNAPAGYIVGGAMAIACAVAISKSGVSSVHMLECPDMEELYGREDNDSIHE